MLQNKVSITQKEIDDVYEIIPEQPKIEQDTTEEDSFLSEEEESFDTAMHDQEAQEDKSE